MKGMSHNDSKVKVAAMTERGVEAKTNVVKLHNKGDTKCKQTEVTWD